MREFCQTNRAQACSRTWILGALDRHKQFVHGCVLHLAGFGFFLDSGLSASECVRGFARDLLQTMPSMVAFIHIHALMSL